LFEGDDGDERQADRVETVRRLTQEVPRVIITYVGNLPNDEGQTLRHSQLTPSQIYLNTIEIDLNHERT